MPSSSLAVVVAMKAASKSELRKRTAQTASLGKGENIVVSAYITFGDSCFIAK
jgi:hypothetical protein